MQIIPIWSELLFGTSDFFLDREFKRLLSFSVFLGYIVFSFFEKILFDFADFRCAVVIFWRAITTPIAAFTPLTSSRTLIP
jgi:hypothetical protein